MGRRKGPSLSREDVVEAGVALVLEEGPDALGVSRVARALGIQPPSIYNHVGKGAALPQAVCLAGTERLLAALTASVEGIDDPTRRLHGLAHAMRAWVHDHEGLYGLMARVPPRPEDPAFVALSGALLQLFRTPLASLGVPPNDQVHAMRSLRAAVHGFVLLEAAGQFRMQEDPDASFARMVEALVRGLVS